MGISPREKVALHKPMPHVIDLLEWQRLRKAEQGAAAAEGAALRRRFAYCADQERPRDLDLPKPLTPRHCDPGLDPGEAIQRRADMHWIASSLCCSP